MMRRTLAPLLAILLALGGGATGERPRPAEAGDRSAAERSLAAALRVLNGVPASECAAGGLTPPAGRDTCVRATPAALAAAESGLLLVQASTGPDVQPFIALMGARADGEWDLWFTAPATLVPAFLPSPAKACFPGALMLRAEPSLTAPVLAAIPEESIVTLDRFQLARTGSWSRSAAPVRGEGWYRVAGPTSGWVSAGYLVVADGDCGAALDR